ncbi:copper chaperone PCu(A)C [Streptomyces sp. NPDC002540]
MTKDSAMKNPGRPAVADGWTPSRRRLREGLVAALAPLTACCVALGGLTAWTATGAAGSPPRIEVGDGRVFVPYNSEGNTAAFFRIVNNSGVDDRLVAVTSVAVDSAMLSRHARHDGGAGSMRMIGSAGVPAGRTLTMSANTVDVMLKLKGHRQVGETLPFVLHFRHSDPIETVAVMVRPGG